MSVEFVSILVLCLIFLIATLLPVHMGALGIGAAFVTERRAAYSATSSWR